MNEHQSLGGRIDRIADEFDAALQRGETPLIEEYLRDCPPAERSTLLEELLRIEFEVRQESDTESTVENYYSRFSDETEVVRRVVGGGLRPVEQSLESTIIPAAADLTAPSIAASSPVGEMTTLGEYEILEEIARGGMGVVYQARQTQLNRVVALKLIKSGELAGDDEVQRFRNEAEAAAQLDHPNIVPIYEVGEQDGRHFFSMGFVDGVGLDVRLKEGPLPPREAAELIKTIAEAVQYAHEKGIVHRDLKPANVLIDNDGNPRITDFGLAKKVDDDSGMTATGQVMGTPSYMPPEQAEGKLEQIGPASDVYALGAMLYATLTGRPPFQAANVMETLKQVLEQDPVSPRVLNPAVDRDLETICVKCLEKEAAGRYDSAGSLAADLDCFLSGRPITARPIGRPAQFWRWCKRHPARAGFAAASVIALLAVVGASVAINYQGRLEDTNTQLETANSQLESTNSQLQSSNTDLNTALKSADSAKRQADSARAAEKRARLAETQAKDELDKVLCYNRVKLALALWNNEQPARARQLLKDCPNHLRGWEWHYVYRVCHPEDLSITTYSGRLGSARFGPDGTWFATTGSDRDGLGYLKTWRTDSGRQLASHQIVKRWIAKNSEFRGNRMSIRPDGKEVMTSVGFFRISPDGRTIIGKPYSATLGHPGFREYNRNGTRFSSIDLSFGRRLDVYDSKTKTRIWRRSDLSSNKTLVPAKFSPDGRYIVTYGDFDGDKDVRTRLVLLNSQTGKQYPSFTPQFSSSVQTIAYHPNGKLLAVGERNVITLINATSGSEILTLNGNFQYGFDSPPCLEFSPDGRWIAVATRNNTIRIVDSTNGKDAMKLTGHESSIYSIDFSRNGKFLLSSDRMGVVKVWNLSNIPRIDNPKLAGNRSIYATTHLLVRSHDGSKTLFAERVVDRRYDHVNRRWVSGTWVLRIRNTEMGTLVSQLQGSSQTPSRGQRSYRGSFEFLPNGRQVGGIMYCHKFDWGDGFTVERLLCIWDITTGRRVASTEMKQKQGKHGATTGKSFIAGYNGEQWVRQITKIQRNQYNGKKRTIVWKGNNLIRFVGTHTGKVNEVELAGPFDAIGPITLSQDGRFTAAKTSNGEVVVWNCMTGAVAHRFVEKQGATNKSYYFLVKVAFSPDGSAIASIDETRMLRKWDLRTGKLSYTKQLLLGGDVVFSPDSQRIGVFRTGSLVLLDSETGRRTLELRELPFKPLRFSRDGKQIVGYDSNSKEITRLDARTGIWSDADRWHPLLRSIVKQRQSDQNNAALVRQELQARRFIGLDHHRNRRFAEAEKQFLSSLKLARLKSFEPTTRLVALAVAECDLGLVIADQQRRGEASKLLRKGLVRLRGVSSLPSWIVPRVLSACRRYLKYYPNDAKVLSFAARAAELHGQFAEARRYSERYLNVGPRDEQVTSRLATSIVKGLAKIWVPLQFSRLSSRGGATFTTVDENSVFVSGKNVSGDIYTVTAGSPQRSIRAIRLDALSHNRLPLKGPGRHSSGNFQLESIQLFVTSVEQPGQYVQIPFASAWASYEYPSAPTDADVRGTIAPGKNTSWHVFGRTGQSHYAVFTLRKPLQLKPGQELKIALRHRDREGGVNLGRFRLSVTSTRLPIIGEWLRSAVSRKKIKGIGALSAAYAAEYLAR